MSKLYDDLKRKQVARASPAQADQQLDLFSHVQQTPPSPADAPPRIPEAAPPQQSAADSVSMPLFRRGLERSAALAGVIEPLSGLPPIRRRRRAPWLYVGISAVAVAAIAGGVWAVRWWSHKAADSRAQSEPATAARVEQPVTAAAPAIRASPPKTDASQPKRITAVTPAQPGAGRATSDTPIFQVRGARVETVGKVHIVIFDDAVFMGATRIAPRAADALRSLAKQLAPYGRRVSVTVIGCTDNTPVRSGSRFRDNMELGLARAHEVARFMKNAGPLPSAEFQTLSYGERWAPFPNDTPQHRAKNRTAVLRISLRD